MRLLEIEKKNLLKSLVKLNYTSSSADLNYNYQCLVNCSWQYYINKKQLSFYVLNLYTVKVKFINVSDDQITSQNYLSNHEVLFKCMCMCVFVFMFVFTYGW